MSSEESRKLDLLEQKTTTEVTEEQSVSSETEGQTKAGHTKGEEKPGEAVPENGEKLDDTAHEEAELPKEGDSGEPLPPGWNPRGKVNAPTSGPKKPIRPK
ncbi:hypothetical protein K435DRAFT_779396 [Dendrothele bispora CBS 962.96]|uniref:Uncharacterized protein n=1 Tax=Dendrothele bispora (strain CBS 962.96) TaxID=1314807 RepID=A0A4S8LZ48_DENBC|nr:hypothetical protein K435DRAFT_779396 [Dendrothele bispora CBS 962.96]